MKKTVALLTAVTLAVTFCMAAQTLVNLTNQVQGILPIANGGSGSASPAIVAGTGISVSGSWPNQTINATGTGSVSSFSAGNLSPLFTTSVATSTTTPALTFSLSNAGAHAFLGNNTGSTAAPAYVQPAFTDLAGSVSAAQMATAWQYRVCTVIVGSDDASAVIASTNLGPQHQVCFVPAASTVVEMDVSADAGTPNVITGRNRAGSIVNLVSGALATAGSGGVACSNTGGTTGLNGSTTCSATLQNTSLNAGDYFDLVSGTPGGTAKRMTIVIIYKVT